MSTSFVVSWSEAADDDVHVEYRELAAPTLIAAIDELRGGPLSGAIQPASDRIEIGRKGVLMGKHHDQPPSTSPVKTAEVSGNDPNAKPQTPPPVQPVGGLTDPNVPVHQVKPISAPLPVGQEGAVSLRYVVQPDGMTVQIYGTLEGTGGAGADMGVHSCVTVS